MRLLAPGGGQAGGLGLQADAQLQHGEHVDRFTQLMGAEHHARCAAGGQHKGADAMLGFHQTRGLQLGQRLAHDRAADIVVAYQLGLGRQLVALLQQALADLVFKLFRQQIGQTAAAFGGPAAAQAGSGVQGHRWGGGGFRGAFKHGCDPAGEGPGSGLRGHGGHAKRPPCRMPSMGMRVIPRGFWA